MLVIGQSLECWRPPLAAAVARRDPAPLLERAGRQLAAGAHALDVNLGAQPRAGLADDLIWAASTLRAMWPDVTLFLDCGDLDALALAIGTTSGPTVANAIPLDGAPAAEVMRLFDAAAASDAGAVFSPRAADREDATSAILTAAEEMRLLVASAGIRGPLFLDCLAYPPALSPERCRRSLVWLRALRDAGAAAVQPLVAVGNVGHRAPVGLRGALGAVYVVLAIASGATALLVRAEDRVIMSLIEVMTDRRKPMSDVERWALAVRELPARQQFNWPPPGSEARAAWALIVGGSPL